MKNLTLSVDDQVLATVRRHAAEAGTSVNAMVREFLQGIADKEDRARRARQRIRELSEGSRARVGERVWSRDELHAR
ncbi:MAG: ribbon-helix-helix protein, CopG family [Holophagales bacterium]|nr:ribbon-helix-helix protein, CopG family [Holophagales bacterium]